GCIDLQEAQQVSCAIPHATHMAIEAYQQRLLGNRTSRKPKNNRPAPLAGFSDLQLASFAYPFDKLLFSPRKRKDRTTGLTIYLLKQIQNHLNSASPLINRLWSPLKRSAARQQNTSDALRTTSGASRCLSLRRSQSDRC